MTSLLEKMAWKKSTIICLSEMIHFPTMCNYARHAKSDLYCVFSGVYFLIEVCMSDFAI